MNNDTNDRLDSIDRRLEQLVILTQQQYQTAALQTENIRNLVSAVSEIAAFTLA